MNIYISCDIEGIDGIVSLKQSDPTGPFYAFAREQITAEVNAAAQGAFDAGASWTSLPLLVSLGTRCEQPDRSAFVVDPACSRTT